jgi:hypothetical protein
MMYDEKRVARIQKSPEAGKYSLPVGFLPAIGNLPPATYYLRPELCAL